VTSLSASNILAAFWALGSTVWFNKALCDILIPNWQCQTKVLHCWPRNLDSLPSSRWCIFHSILFFLIFSPFFVLCIFYPTRFTLSNERCSVGWGQFITQLAPIDLNCHIVCHENSSNNSGRLSEGAGQSSWYWTRLANFYDIINTMRVCIYIKLLIIINTKKKNGRKRGRGH